MSEKRAISISQWKLLFPAEDPDTTNKKWQFFYCRCGGYFAIRLSEYKRRTKRNPDGKLFCSAACPARRTRVEADIKRPVGVSQYEEKQMKDWSHLKVGSDQRKQRAIAEREEMEKLFGKS